MPTSSRFSPTVATIDLSAVAHNVAQVRRCVAPSCDIIAVVKANAYGHGLVEMTQALQRLGIARFGVATIEEGLTLRAAGIQAPIVMLGALFPPQIPDLVANSLTPVIHEPAGAAALAKQLSPTAQPYAVHLKVETGMGRLGLTLAELSTMLSAAEFKGPLRLEGLMTHLADADGDDRSFSDEQLAQFHAAVDRARQAGFKVPLVHAANSAAIVRYPAAHFSAVRPGIMLYGYHTLPALVTSPELKPVLSLTTTVVQVRKLPVGASVSYNRTFVAKRPTHIAVLPIGYADGFNRLLSNRGAVLLRGQRAPVVGSVCMDMTMVDVTEIAAVQAGDQAVVIGQRGTLAIRADDVAELLGTIPYEVLCAIGPRVPRHYQAV